jgi:hypothetical protein
VVSARRSVPGRRGRVVRELGNRWVAESPLRRGGGGPHESGVWLTAPAAARIRVAENELLLSPAGRPGVFLSRRCAQTRCAARLSPRLGLTVGNTRRLELSRR